MLSPGSLDLLTLTKDTEFQLTPAGGGGKKFRPITCLEQQKQEYKLIPTV